MKRTRRVRYQRKTKTRKQKGGRSIFVDVAKPTPSGEEKIEKIEVKISANTTPRNIFNIYRQANLRAQRGNRALFLPNGTTPRFRLKSNQVRGLYWPAVSKKNWNVKGKEYQNGKSYYFEYIETLPEENRARRIASHEILRPVLEHCLRVYGGAKVIPGSSAATDNIQKNINQQFKFHKPPSNPIILIDEVFFMPGRYDFYKYLLFNEDTGLSSHLDPTGNHVKVFRKPEGVPFKINPARSDIPISLDEKREYLEELRKSLVSEDGTVLFNEMDLLEIYCVNISIEGLEIEKRGPFFDFLKGFGERPDHTPVFSAYGYGE